MHHKSTATKIKRCSERACLATPLTLRSSADVVALTVVVLVVVLTSLLITSMVEVDCKLRVVVIKIDDDVLCVGKRLAMGVAPTGAQFPRTQIVMVCILVPLVSSGSFDFE